MEKNSQMKHITGGIGFLGTGNMGQALMGGLIRAGVVKSPGEIFGHDIRKEQLDYLKEKFHIQPCNSNTDVLKKTRTILLAVKPQNMEELLTEIFPSVKKHHLFITIAAGISTRFIEKRLKGKPRVIRVMPNTPALIQEGISALSKGANASEEDLFTAETIFNSVGKTISLQERHLNAVTALSGSGPAYFFFLIECLIKAGRLVGLPQEAAELLVKQTAVGAALMCRDSEKSPDKLREMVTSPKGTTYEALKVMKKLEFDTIILKAIVAATNRAKELGSNE